MAEGETGLSRQKGKCVGKSRQINPISLELVFRGPNEECSHNPNEISSLGSELIFRQIPGKLVQGCRHAQWFWRGRGLRRTLLDPVAGCVIRAPAAPTRLGLLPTRPLAFRLAAGMLPLAYPRVRPEPPAADPARSLPGLWHGDASWSPRFAASGPGFRSEGLGHFWKVWVGHFSRAPKPKGDQNPW